MTYSKLLIHSPTTIAFSILLTACGGGGGGDASSTTEPETETPPVTTQTDPVDNYAWEKNTFLDETIYKGRCNTPRSGTSDIQGSELDEKFWLRSWNNNVYLWYKDIVDQDPNLLTSPSDYFNSSLVSTLTTSSGEKKDSMSIAVSTQELSNRIHSGVESGYGMKLISTTDTLPRKVFIAYIQPNSPASKANLKRGAQILEIDGVDYLNANSSIDLETFSKALSPAGNGETHTFKVQGTTTSTPREVSLISADVAISPVQNSHVITANNEKIGYLVFNNNIDNAVDPLIESFKTFKQENINDLVLDLRYNTGGAAYVSTLVASLISGEEKTENKIFSSMVFNDKHPKNNPFTETTITPEYFYNEAKYNGQEAFPIPRLGLNRVYVLTGENSCSSSELIINGLKGVGIEVIGIGATTCGQPYGAVPIDNCGTSYISTNFKNINARGTGDYTAGFTPVCKVSDDVSKQLGDKLEARLAAALEYRTSGTCPSSQSQIGTEVLLATPTWQKALIIQ